MDASQIKMLMDALKGWQEATESNTIGSFQTFVLVVLGRRRNEAVRQQSIEETLDIARDQVSLYLKAMSQRGLGLVNIERNPENWRTNVLTLTAKGEKLARILNLL